MEFRLEANIMGYGRGAVPTLLVLRTFCTTGMQYAAVLPLPVRARARMSRLSRASGMALACTNVGRANPMSARARNIRASRRCENAAKDTLWSARDGSGIDCGEKNITITNTNIITRTSRTLNFGSYRWNVTTSSHH